MRIDVTKRPAKAKFPVGVLIVILIIAVFVFSRNTKDETQPQPKPTTQKAIVIVPPIGQAASTKVDDWAKSNGYELRRYSEQADVSTAEAYLQPLYALALDRSPCAVVLADGVQTVVPIDDNFLTKLESLR